MSHEPVPPNTARTPTLSVIVPAYREANTIQEALSRLTEALDATERDYEVIVVSDGNVDGTELRAIEFGHERVSVLDYASNRGKGFAIRHGASSACGQLVVFIDADLDIHPDGVEPLIQLLERTPADVVVASKVHPASTVFYPMFRRFQSGVLRQIVRRLFALSVADTQTGLKVFRADVLHTCLPHVTSEGYAFDLELLVLASDHGYTLVEGPLDLDFNFSSTTGARAIGEVVRELARLHRRRRAGLRDGTWLS
ncbi:MAG: glycosyltransferase [Ilumatobacteraceae bacterium]